MLPQEQQKKIQTNKQKFCDKKGIIVSQNNRPQSYNILNKMEIFQQETVVT